MKSKIILTCLGAFASLSGLVSSASAQVIVPGNANIFGAGHAFAPAPGGGTGGDLPPFISFAPAPGRTFTFSVSGKTSDAFGLIAPDGGGFGLFTTDITSYGGISGIIGPGVIFMVGVFLDANTPGGSAPSVLDFRASGLGTNFLTLSPAIDQTFYIGDGLTGNGSGSIQQFVAPDTASRLFLGFADHAYGSSGLPGFYQDNGKNLFVTISSTDAGPTVSGPSMSAVPEPSTYGEISVAALLGLVAWRCKRRTPPSASGAGSF